MGIFKRKDKSAAENTAKEYVEKIMENYKKLDLDSATDLAAEIIVGGNMDDKKVEQFKVKLKEINQRLEEMSDDCTSAGGDSIYKSNSRSGAVVNNLKNLLDSWIMYNETIVQTEFTKGVDLSARYDSEYEQVVSSMEKLEKNKNKLKKGDTFFSVKEEIEDLVDGVRIKLPGFQETLSALGKGIGSLEHMVKKVVKLPDGTEATYKETDQDLLSQVVQKLSTSSVGKEYEKVTKETDDKKRANAYVRYQNGMGLLLLKRLENDKKKTINPIKRIKIDRAIKSTEDWTTVNKHLAVLNKKNNGDPTDIPQPLIKKEIKYRKILAALLKQVSGSSTQSLKSAVALFRNTAEDAVACVEQGKTLAEIEKASEGSEDQKTGDDKNSAGAENGPGGAQSGNPPEEKGEKPPEKKEDNIEPADEKKSGQFGIEQLRLKVATSTSRDVDKNFAELAAAAEMGDPDAIAAIEDIANNQSGDATYQAQRVARKFLRDRRDKIEKARAVAQLNDSGHLEAGRKPDPTKLSRSVEIESDGHRKTKKMAVGKNYSPLQLFKQLEADGTINTNRAVVGVLKRILLSPAKKGQDGKVEAAITEMHTAAAAGVGEAKLALKALMDSGVRVVIEHEKKGLSEYLTDNVHDLAENVRKLCVDALDDKSALRELVFTSAMNANGGRLDALNKMNDYNSALFGNAYTAADAIHGQNPDDRDFKSAVLALPDEASEWGVSKTEQINAFKKVAEESVLDADKAALIDTLHGAIAGWANVDAIGHLHTVCNAIQAAAGGADNASKSAAIKCCQITGVPGIKEADCKQNTLKLFKDSLTQANMKASLRALNGINDASLNGSKAFIEFYEVCDVITDAAKGHAANDGATSAADPVWTALIGAAGTDGGDFHPDDAACRKLEADANLGVAGLGDLISNLRAIANGKAGATTLKNKVDANAGYVADWRNRIGAGGQTVAGFKNLIDGAGGAVGAAGADNDVKAEWFPVMGIGYNINGAGNDGNIKKELDQMIIKINCKIPSAAVADKHKDILGKINDALTNAGGGAPDWSGVAATHNFGANFAAAVTAVDPAQNENLAAGAVRNALTAADPNLPVDQNSDAFTLGLKTYAISSADADRKAVGDGALGGLEGLAKAGDTDAMNILKRLANMAAGAADDTKNAVVRKNVDQIETAYKVAKDSIGAADASYLKNRGDITDPDIKRDLAAALNGDVAALDRIKDATRKVTLEDDEIYGTGVNRHGQNLNADYRKRNDANRALEIYNNKQIANDALKSAIVNALKTADRRDPDDVKVLDPVIIQWIFDAMVPGDGVNDVNKNARMFIVNAASAGGSQAKSVILALDKTLKLASPAPLPVANRNTLVAVATEAHKKYEAAHKK